MVIYKTETNVIFQIRVLPSVSSFYHAEIQQRNDHLRSFCLWPQHLLLLIVHSNKQGQSSLGRQCLHIVAKFRQVCPLRPLGLHFLIMVSLRLPFPSLETRDTILLEHSCSPYFHQHDLEHRILTMHTIPGPLL